MKQAAGDLQQAVQGKADGLKIGGMPMLPLAWAAGLTLLLLCGPLLPAARLFPTPASYLPVHTMLEFVATAVSAMVFALGWNLRRQDENNQAILLAAACLGFVLVDLAHTLSYQGMPDFVTPSGPEKAINFWLAGRLMVGLGLFTVALLPLQRWSPAACWLAVGSAVAAACLAWWIGLYYPHQLPHTFIPGRGLTPFKIVAELAEAALFGLAGFLLLLRARRERKNDLFWLAAGSWVLALSGLFLSVYQDVTDLYNLLGHIYAALAYVMIYRAVFVAGVAAPYQALARQQSLLHSLVDSLRQSEASLQAYRDHLEELVAARTKELEEARAEAERLSQVKGDFLADMSHEIRTPLNAILGLAQVGERQHADGKTRESFQRILDSGEMLLGVINDILDFSKIEAGKLRLEQGSMDLGQVIDHAVDLVAVRAESKGLEFRIDEAADLPAACRGDPLRLSQVLVNLLTNAIKFTEQGSVTLNIGRDGDWLVLCVEDTGIGMNPAQSDRLFTPFEQADSSTPRRFGGSGLGLAICKRLVDLMGGEIRVSSAEAMGSRFEVRLPLVDTVPAAVPVGLVALGRFPAAEGRSLLGALADRGAKVAEIPDTAVFPPDTALAVVPGEALGDADFCRQLQAVLEAGGRVAVIQAADENDRSAALHNRAIPIHRPLRPGRLLALLSEPTAAPAPSPAGPRLAGLSFLAAEDNPVNRMVLEDIMVLEGARLVCLENGIELLERLRRDGADAYDLVITDIQMPGMDGYELTRHLRELAPGLPVIGLTAHAMAEARAHCLAAGMAEHVAKPIDIDQLVAVLRRHSRRPAAIPPTAAAAASHALPQSGPGTEGRSIGWSDLEIRYRNRPGFIDKLLSIVVKHTGEIPAALRAAILAEDLPRLTFLAHNLKSTAGNLAAPSLYDLAARTEQAARAGRPEAAQLADELAASVEAMLAEITARTPAETAPA